MVDNSSAARTRESLAVPCIRVLAVKSQPRYHHEVRGTYVDDRSYNPCEKDCSGPVQDRTVKHAHKRTVQIPQRHLPPTTLHSGVRMV